MFKNKKILITGGLGFIGSNLAHRLVKLGARVTLLDSMIPDYGGNEVNVQSIRHKVIISYTDLRDQYALAYLIRGQHYIFSLAGQVSHMDSMSDPITDLEINSRAQLSLLESCRKHNPRTKIIYASTRQIYGKSNAPTRESDPLAPTDINGINKMSGEMFYSLYHRVYDLNTTSLRLTNCYGPRQLIKHNRQGFVAWFINRCLLNKTVQIYGDGQQYRDFTYVDDVVEAFVKVAQSKKTAGEVYNLGGIRKYTLNEVCSLLKKENPKLKIQHIPFPQERKKIDIGSTINDWQKINKAVGWHPTVSLARGLHLTLKYYRRHLQDYITDVSNHES